MCFAPKLCLLIPIVSLRMREPAARWAASLALSPHSEALPFRLGGRGYTAAAARESAMPHIFIDTWFSFIDTWFLFFQVYNISFLPSNLSQQEVHTYQRALPGLRSPASSQVGPVLSSAAPR